MTKEFYIKFISIDIVSWVKMFDQNTGEYKLLSPSASEEERREFGKYVLPHLASGEKTGNIVLKDGSWLYRTGDNRDVFKRVKKPSYGVQPQTEIDNIIANIKRNSNYGC